MDHPFRTAAVGGFNRQDVLSYLETTTKETAQRQQALQKQLDEAAAKAEEQEQQLARLQEQADKAQSLQEQVDTLTAQLQKANAQIDQLHGEREEMASKVRELNTQVDRLRPGSEAYDAIKEKTAGLEMDALHRAQVIQDEAKDQARQLRRRMESWICSVEQEYENLRSQVETTVSYASEQLTRAGENLDKVTALMNDQEVTLKSLDSDYAATAPDRVQPPMPLNENE